jgi:glucose-1-phosphate cytidylyltransferase
MKVVILCGGKGIRAFPFSEYMPKPMMPVGGAPILRQIIRLFVESGFTEFVLAAGHRKSVLDDYFEGKEIGGRIEIVDTGEGADTGDRILACKHLLGERFIATYGDGLSDLPLAELVKFHDSHGGIATMSCVPLYSQYGVVDIEPDGRIERIREKPHLKDKWINAGFFVFDKAVFDDWKGRNLESQVLPHLIGQGKAYAYRHGGFFKSLDSYKDQQEFEELIAGERLPWLRYPRANGK